jgi:hypothetical protein
MQVPQYAWCEAAGMALLSRQVEIPGTYSGLVTSGSLIRIVWDIDFVLSATSINRCGTLARCRELFK